jgi:superfamily II DNA/RNA helicase
MDDSSVIPDFDGYKDAVVDKTSELDRYLKDISSRADLVRSRVVDKKADNLLKITTDGRKAALDIRLVEPNAGFTYQSKVARCAENVFNIYMKTFFDKSTQLIFCDTSTPKNTFNVYDEMKRLLLLMGVKENEIAFVHDATTENERNKLFNKMRTGEIRVLIGSTFKLGLGVNVQDKLIALHHVDVPWRPADMVQREGRILRQGNKNEEVYIFRYVSAGSFDAYSWQLLETKQKFIDELLANSISARSALDVSDTVLNYGEVKALAIGNMRLRERFEIYNELNSKSPKLILVAMGSPRQEKFIYNAKRYLKPALMIGIGGSLDVWSGAVKRAPMIFQKLGLEWLYRTVTQPERFKRIFPTLPLFLIKAFNYKFSK